MGFVFLPLLFHVGSARLAHMHCKALTKNSSVIVWVARNASHNNDCIAITDNHHYCWSETVTATCRHRFKSNNPVTVVFSSRDSYHCKQHISSPLLYFLHRAGIQLTWNISVLLQWLVIKPESKWKEIGESGSLDWLLVFPAVQYFTT